MKAEVEVFTPENRPVCKTADRCGGKMAALSTGKLAYKGFCSGCYQADKAERRANALHDERAGIVQPAKARPASRTDRSSSGTTSSSGLQDGGDTDGSQLANKGDQRPKLASSEQPGRGQKRPPGGGGFPQPGPAPTDEEEVRQLTTVFGWCMTGHHEGMTDVDPDGRTGLLAGSFPILCPGIVWMSMQNHWAGCPCLCHSLESSALNLEDVAGQTIHEGLVTA